MCPLCLVKRKRDMKVVKQRLIIIFSRTSFMIKLGLKTSEDRPFSEKENATTRKIRIFLF